MLPILTSTRQTQGQRASDFCFCEEDEVVYFGFVCERDNDTANPDLGCGCARQMRGVLSHQGTTTFKVTHRDFTVQSFVDYYLGAQQDAGWLRGDDPEGRAAFVHDAMQLLTVAAGFPIGTVLEKRGAYIHARTDRTIADALREMQ